MVYRDDEDKAHHDIYSALKGGVITYHSRTRGEIVKNHTGKFVIRFPNTPEVRAGLDVYFNNGLVPVRDLDHLMKMYKSLIQVAIANDEKDRSECG